MIAPDQARFSARAFLSFPIGLNLLALLVAFVAGPASADEFKLAVNLDSTPARAADTVLGPLTILAADFSTTPPSHLYRVNPDTGATTLVTQAALPIGIDFRSNGVLYGANVYLFTISSVNGTGVLINTLPEIIVSIAFSPTDELYGISNENGSLYKIDPNDGRILAKVTITGTVVPGSGTPFPNEIRAIDFGPDGKLYGIGFGLYQINPTTGVATRITPLATTVAPGIVLFGGLDFGPDRVLRATTAVLSTTGNSDLYVVNPGTGIGQLVGGMGNNITDIASFAETFVSPVITAQPASVSVTSGQIATFQVTATGTPAPTYQWRKDGINIAGATGATLTLTNITPSAAGSYSVVITNPGGSVTSNAATLTVPLSRLINLSILTALNRTGDTFTVGTVVGGAGTGGGKPLVIRAVGPSLTQLGVTGVLGDPQIDIFSGATLTATNDNWGGTPALSTAFTQVGAFPLSGATSRDSAVFSTLAAGGYTVQVSGVGGTTGTVIAEVYDGTVNTDFTPATPRLVNLSVRKDVPAGTSLTAGFTVGGGPASLRVLIRAIGPGLVPFGVGGVMGDPTITVFDAGSRPVTSNDNWGGSAALSAAFSAVGAFTLDAASRDAAVLVTLQPGNYTAQVSGANGTGGQVLVEVYEAP